VNFASISQNPIQFQSQSLVWYGLNDTLKIEIEIRLEYNQSEEKKPISSLVNFVLIDQNPIQSQSQSLVWYGLKPAVCVQFTHVQMGPLPVYNRYKP